MRRSDRAIPREKETHMKKFSFIGGALVIGLVGAFANVANAQQAAPTAPQAAPGAGQGGGNAQQLTPEQRQARLEQRFKEANKKGDGKLTLDEAKAGFPRVAENFAEIDKDKKGYVTLDEVKAALAARGR